jgi:hypothetical protein
LASDGNFQQYICQNQLQLFTFAMNGAKLYVCAQPDRKSGTAPCIFQLSGRIKEERENSCVISS